MKPRLAVLLVCVVALALAADSLNCHLVGNWPFGPSSNAAVDPTRQLAFCGSGGGAYVLDVSNPAAPAVLSDGIRTRGYVRDMSYQDNRLYVA
jgi:hypothetical protein